MGKICSKDKSHYESGWILYGADCIFLESKGM